MKRFFEGKTEFFTWDLKHHSFDSDSQFKVMVTLIKSPLPSSLCRISLFNLSFGMIFPQLIPPSTFIDIFSYVELILIPQFSGLQVIIIPFGNSCILSACPYNKMDSISTVPKKNKITLYTRWWYLLREV